VRQRASRFSISASNNDGCRRDDRCARSRKEYRDEETPTIALRSVTFSVQKGEFVSIMGPSGSGKSTLLHILSFLDRRRAAHICSAGRASTRWMTVSSHTSAIPAWGSCSKRSTCCRAFPYTTTSRFRSSIPRCRPTSAGRALRRRSPQSALRKSSIRKQQALGRTKTTRRDRAALVTDPDVIFADEPTGNLDSVSGGQVMEILESLNDRGRTIVLVTHETATAEFANRIIRIKDGTMESDTPVLKKERHRSGPIK